MINYRHEWKASPTARFARIGGEGVLLDLKSSEFIGIGEDAATIYEMLCSGVSEEQVYLRIHGEPQFAQMSEVHLYQHIHRLIEFLSSRSLLLPDDEDSQSYLRSCLIHSSQLLRHAHLPPAHPLFERWEATLALRCIETWVRQGLFLPLVHALLALPASRHVHAGDVDVKRAMKRVQRAASLQPFKAACLHQSLALCWMLRRRGADVHVCLGCYTHPFLAHVWNECHGERIQWKAGMGPYADRATLEATTVLFHSEHVKKEEGQ